jgi:peptidoglycan/LPS O-acetylase OafA/YrhL
LRAGFRNRGTGKHRMIGRTNEERGKGYRPDIDGLRAIAVIPVVLFHAGISSFSGGYVGVDVFFVISGFLITGILLQDIEGKRYSIWQFYQRRARRIFPALATVVLFTLLASYLYLPPREFKRIGESSIFISFFLSNIYFWQSVGYFEAARTFEPLLHTWSLAVEEQFYLFFPLLLWVLRSVGKYLLSALVITFVLSFISAELLLSSRPRMAFYLMPARTWELMAGGILAVGVLDKFWTRAAARAASWAGLLIIALSVFLYSEATEFPGVAALPPVFGSCLVIWARGEGAADLLAWKPLVWIGVLSYSLYLWHLPIFEFAKYLTDGPLSLGAGLGLSFLSLLVAWFSLHFVEKPFRRSRSDRAADRRAAVAWAGLGSSAAAGVFAVATNGLPSRMSEQALIILAVAEDKTRHPYNCLSLDDKWVPPGSACLLGDTGAIPTVLLWGDSHAMVTATSLQVAAHRNDSSFLFAATADCPIGLGFSVDSTVNPGLTRQNNYRNCEKYNREMLVVAQQPNIRTVVLSSRWTNWRNGEPANRAERVADVRLRTAQGTANSTVENRPIFERGFTELVDRLRREGKSVIIVGPLPEPTYDVPRRAYVSQFGITEPPPPLTLEEYSSRHSTILRFFKAFEGKVTFIWPSEGLCEDGVCPTQHRSIPIYFDHNHLSVAGAKSLSYLYDSVFLRSPKELDKHQVQNFQQTPAARWDDRYSVR